MWIPLPEQLAEFLRMVGFDWPEADEEKLWECGDAWGRFAQTLRNLAEDADRTVDQVLENNTDDSISAFGERWKEFNSGEAAWLTAGVEGAELAQKAFYGCSVIVITLKIAVIAELVVLAYTWTAAIAAAVETFGASLAAAAARTAAVRVTVKLALKTALEAIRRIGSRIIKRAVEQVSKAIKRLKTTVRKAKRGSKPDEELKRRAEELAKKGIPDPRQAYRGRTFHTGDVDPYADALARRLNGKSSQAFDTDPRRREFDTISDDYIASTKDRTTTKLKQKHTQDLKNVFDAAAVTGKTPYFHYQNGISAAERDAIRRYEERYGIKAVIDESPLDV